MSSGIYVITCLPTGKRYIGSSIDIKQRWSNHRSDLNRERHVNAHIQAAWTKHGEHNFGFEVLEVVERGKLKDAEERWLESEKPEFNINPRADAPMRGVSPTPEHRAKISAAHKARGTKPPGYVMTSAERAAFAERMKGNTFGRVVRSEEFKKKVSKTMMGVPKSAETKARMSLAQRKRFNV